jgi:hypothetical protein
MELGDAVVIAWPILAGALCLVRLRWLRRALGALLFLLIAASIVYAAVTRDAALGIMVTGLGLITWLTIESWPTEDG